MSSKAKTQVVWLRDGFGGGGHAEVCLASDYAALEAECERLRKQVAALSGQQPDPWAPSGAAYDLSLHRNPDAKAWADFFVAVFPGQADKHGLMIGWFANAMMAMHDHLKAQQSAHVSVPRDIALALLDDGPRAETWAAQAKLRALLNGGEA